MPDHRHKPRRTTTPAGVSPAARSPAPAAIARTGPVRRPATGRAALRRAPLRRAGRFQRSALIRAAATGRPGGFEGRGGSGPTGRVGFGARRRPIPYRGPAASGRSARVRPVGLRRRLAPGSGGSGSRPGGPGPAAPAGWLRPGGPRPGGFRGRAGPPAPRGFRPEGPGPADGGPTRRAPLAPRGASGSPTTHGRPGRHGRTQRLRRWAGFGRSRGRGFGRATALRRRGRARPAATGGCDEGSSRAEGDRTGRVRAVRARPVPGQRRAATLAPRRRLRPAPRRELRPRPGARPAPRLRRRPSGPTRRPSRDPRHGRVRRRLWPVRAEPGRTPSAATADAMPEPSTDPTPDCRAAAGDSRGRPLRRGRRGRIRRPRPSAGARPDYRARSGGFVDRRPFRPGRPRRRPGPGRPAARRRADLLGEDEELVAGRHPVEEAFIAHRKAIRLLVVPQRRQALEKLVLHATNLRIPIVEVEGGTLTSLAGFDGHQGIALVTDRRQFAGLDDILARAIERKEAPFVLVLDSLEDPQNFGSLLANRRGVGRPRRHLPGTPPGAPLGGCGQGLGRGRRASAAGAGRGPGRSAHRPARPRPANHRLGCRRVADRPPGRPSRPGCRRRRQRRARASARPSGVAATPSSASPCAAASPRSMPRSPARSFYMRRRASAAAIGRWSVPSRDSADRLRAPRRPAAASRARRSEPAPARPGGGRPADAGEPPAAAAGRRSRGEAETRRRPSRQATSAATEAAASEGPDAIGRPRKTPAAGVLGHRLQRRRDGRMTLRTRPPTVAEACRRSRQPALVAPGSRLTGQGASQYHSRAPRGLSVSMPLRPPT